MVDKLSPERRSANMAKIASKNTKPEMLVRRITHSLGYRYRLHQKDLPGKPDLVFSRRRAVIFVHGCFWHGHSDPTCKDAALPKSRTEYWHPKLARNKERDAAQIASLEQDGWTVLIVWECETQKVADLAVKLQQFLGQPRQ